jgi:hypothetical protein
MYDAYQAKMAVNQAAAYADKKKRDELVFKSQLAVGEERAKKIGGSVNVLDGAVKLPNGNMMPAGSVVVLDAAGNIDLSGTEAAAKSAQVATITGFNAQGQPMYGSGTAPRHTRRSSATFRSSKTYAPSMAVAPCSRRKTSPRPTPQRSGFNSR